MAYTKTDWTDNTSPPINAQNLDKIEQGIEDAHTNAAAAQSTADAAIAKAILDAAGDLLTASAADTPARLAKGSDDEVLSVTSGALDYRKIVNAMVDASAAIEYAKLNLASSIVNADVDDAAAIAYSKLNLAGSILNADINASAAIAYSKLNLASSIVNADISASAAIAYSKLALTNEIVNADIDDAAAIAYSKLSLSDSIVNADINSSAAIAFSKLAASAWTTYTPALTVTTGTNPTLGTGSLQEGRYMQIGKLVVATARINFGSSGAAAGSGGYEVSLPVAARTAADVYTVGSGIITEAGVDNHIVIPHVSTGSTSARVLMVVEGANLVSNASPFAWGANDRISLSLLYEAA